MLNYQKECAHSKKSDASKEYKLMKRRANLKTATVKFSESVDLAITVSCTIILTQNVVVATVLPKTEL